MYRNCVDVAVNIVIIIPLVGAVLYLTQPRSIPVVIGRRKRRDCVQLARRHTPKRINGTSIIREPVYPVKFVISIRAIEPVAVGLFQQQVIVAPCVGGQNGCADP